MKILCSCCEQWTNLPAGGDKGPHAHALCEHCNAPLAVDDYYRVCADCGQHYLTEYKTCPLCMSEGRRAEQASEEFAAAFGTGLSRRKSRKGEEYWQIFFDYEPPAAANG